ncbi:MAG TPA: polyphenol oxidase family protein, partial [Fodinibius sp.]|nr:polyphenol oxidase family protein [Fodinibius sp.]
FITTIPGLVLAIQVADCAAVLLWDASNHIVGAFHAGWRGAAAGIIPKGIQMMKRRGAEAGSLKAFVSPCISLQNFEVGPEVSALFPSSFIDEDHFQRPHVDLKGFIKSQLREQGIPASNIEVRGECTVDGRDSYYSFRREGAESGRMMALIRMNR